MNRQWLHESLAYFTSGIAHVCIFGALAIVGNSAPVPWATRPGRASIALSASMAATPRPQDIVEPELPISIERSRPTPVAIQLSKTTSVPKRPLPKLEIGPKLELPTPRGKRRPVAPASSTAKVEQATRELKAKASEPTDRPASRPPVVQPQVKLAAVASQASAASQASTGTETTAKPVAGNPNPPYPPDVLQYDRFYNSDRVRVVKLRVTVTAQGKVAAVRVEVSSGVASIDNTAVQVMRQWRFEPGRRGGRAVEMDIIQPVTYSLPPP
ncbi:MAG TPA: TonB family protein [Pirellulales bacterium]|nr:TonB family protein [Pirellulales bacterium]